MLRLLVEGALFTRKATVLLKPQDLGTQIKKGLQLGTQNKDKTKREVYDLLSSGYSAQWLANLFYGDKNINGDKRGKPNSSPLVLYNDPNRYLLQLAKPSHHSVNDLNQKLQNSCNTDTGFQYLGKLILNRAINLLHSYQPGWRYGKEVEVPVKEKMLAGLQVQLGLELAFLKLACQKLFRSNFNFRSPKEFIAALRNLIKNNIKIITGLATINMAWEPIIYKTIGNHHDPRYIYYQFKSKYFALDIDAPKANQQDLNLTITPTKSLVDKVVQRLKPKLAKLDQSEILGCPGLRMRVTAPDGGTQNLIEVVHDWFCKVLETTLYPWLERNSAAQYVNRHRILDFSF